MQYLHNQKATSNILPVYDHADFRHTGIVLAHWGLFQKEPNWLLL